MRINYGIDVLKSLYEEYVRLFNSTVDSSIVAEMACYIFLSSVYELEVTEYGGLDAEKIEEYKSLCNEFRKFLGVNVIA